MPRIDELPTTLFPRRDHILAAMKDGVSSGIPVGDFLDLVKAEILGAGVPAALDTLDELAAALADDANFAASMTTLLAGKSPLDGSGITSSTFLNNLGFSTFVKTLVNQATAAAFRSAIGAGIGNADFYPGMLISWTGLVSDAPAKWIAPYGQNISRTTYSALHTIYANAGYPYGSGDGSTTFGVIDCRGRIEIGKDDMGGTSANRMTGSGGLSPNGDVLGSAGGEEFHALTPSEGPIHNHGMNFNQGGVVGGNNPPAFLEAGSGVQGNRTGFMASSGSGTGHNNVQPGIVVNKLLYTGV